MRLLALSSSFCSSVLSWVTLPVLLCLMIQSFKVLSLASSFAAHSLMLFFGLALRAFL
jgi:hypothetical protein